MRISEMRLKSILVRDFRRFTNLTVQKIPDTTRLIMLAGPNGCGKSSFFDALHTWHGWKSKKNQSWDEKYHVKTGSINRRRWNNDVEVQFHDPIPTDWKKTLYVRSAYRNDPDVRVDNLQRTGNPLDKITISRMIDNDASVTRNYQQLASNGLEDLYKRGGSSTTFGQYREESIGNIRAALGRLFPKPKLELLSLGNPLDEGTFHFTKGTSHGFMFKNLSGGEKAAFDLILDLVIAQRSYDDTVFCIDEPESHMNARLQAKLLSVLYRLVPNSCQLMLATHSNGMMRRARDIEKEDPGTVVFLDFDRDFDQPQTIEPKRPDRAFWKRAHQIALDDLAALVAPERVVICEGHPRTNRPVRNHSHDARCYECIFEAEFPETRFVSMGNDREVSGDKHGLAQALLSLVNGLEVVRLIDRDDCSDEEVTDARQNGVRILSRRNLESYLFDDEVLRTLAESQGRKDKTDELLAKKNILASGTNGPADNLKPASGQVYNECKKILDLTQVGSNAKAFMRDTLAPLVKPGMSVYEELKRDIFGENPGS